MAAYSPNHQEGQYPRASWRHIGDTRAIRTTEARRGGLDRASLATTRGGDRFGATRSRWTGLVRLPLSAGPHDGSCGVSAVWSALKRCRPGDAPPDLLSLCGRPRLLASLAGQAAVRAFDSSFCVACRHKSCRPTCVRFFTRAQATTFGDAVSASSPDCRGVLLLRFSSNRSEAKSVSTLSGHSTPNVACSRSRNSCRLSDCV